MSHTIIRTAMLCIGIMAVGLIASAEEPPPLDRPDQGVVILRNGQVIEGRISQEDGLYLVDLSDGQIRLKAADVDVVCKSLQEGYQRKRATIHLGNVHDHLELAQWCLKHDSVGARRLGVGRRDGSRPEQSDDRGFAASVEDGRRAAKTGRRLG